jgi:hypothetical protein
LDYPVHGCALLGALEVEGSMWVTVELWVAGCINDECASSQTDASNFPNSDPISFPFIPPFGHDLPRTFQNPAQSSQVSSWLAFSCTPFEPKRDLAKYVSYRISPTYPAEKGFRAQINLEITTCSWGLLGVDCAH